MVEDRLYTTQLQAGLGMIHETLDLLQLWEPGDNPARLVEKAITSGLFSRTTARRARNIVAEMFAPRFLANGRLAASQLKPLVAATHHVEDLKQLFFLYTARAQEIFAEFLVEVYWPRYSSGAHILNRAEAENFIQRGLHNGKMRKRWTETTIRRVSGYLLGCCADFGLLSSSGRSCWAISRFAIRPNVALYLAYDLHFSGMSDVAVIGSFDWRYFGLEQNDVVNQLKGLSHNGHLIMQVTTDLVHISWKYSSMEDCIRAIVKG
jgi:Putative inner membrane protein (DUF1819)